MTANVLEFPIVLFETVVCRNATNKDKCLMDFCKAKIIIFRFANTKSNAQMGYRLCYGL